MKILHLADLHGKRERAEEFLKSVSIARQNAVGVDLIAIAGDTWDSVIQNSAGSRFVEMVEAIRSLADVAPVVMIYGTPTHDVEGSLDVFWTLESRFGITVLDPNQSYFLQGRGVVTEPDSQIPIDALIFGIPEPSKKWLMTQTEDKTAAEAAVRDALRGLFLGLGGIRRSYAALPCVLLYHGQVGGARLQNGDLLENGSGLRPSIDDLAAVGADYIAMGDIHQPQRVGESIGLPAYYPGSGYPINFGETHDAGCNLVELVKNGDFSWAHRVKRVSFGHPVNQTIRAKLVPNLLGSPDLDVDLKAEVKSGNRVKLEISCDKEEAKLDKEEILRKMFSLGAAPGSIVVMNARPVETVRAGDISEKKTSEEKLEVWFRHSKKEFTESLRLKFREIEGLAQEAGTIGRGDRIQIDRLVLRGAIGLKKKSDLDEVDIDFNVIDPGLVALIGHNGAGKTTILENMHPWPGLLTRDGKLRDHFFLRDSFRDLYWTDVKTGYKYRALITMNSAIQSDSTEYYLYRDTGNGFEPLTGIDGRKDSYVEAVNRIFGSQELFLQSAFVTQRQPKNVPNLAEATAGQRKALFSSLCGLEYWEAFKAQAKLKAESEEFRAEIKASEIRILESRLPAIEMLKLNLERGRADLEDAHGDMNILEALGKDKAQALEILREKVNANRQTLQQIDDLCRTILETGLKISGHKATIQEQQKFLSGKDAALQDIQNYERLKAELEIEEGNYKTYLEQLEVERKQVDILRTEKENMDRLIQEKYNEAKKIFDADFGKLTAKSQDLKLSIEKLRGDVRSKESLISSLERQLSAKVEDHCPTCQQLLPEDKRAHILKERTLIQAEQKKFQDEVASILSQIDESEKKLQEMDAEFFNFGLSEPTRPQFETFKVPESKLQPFNKGRLDGLKADLDWIQVDDARRTIQAAETAAVRIEEVSKQIEDLTVQESRDRSKAEQLRLSTNPNLELEFRNLDLQIKSLRTKYDEARKRATEAQVSVTAAERDLVTWENDRSQIEGLRKDNMEIQVTAAEWRFLEGALSDKGVQALELDAIAPSISMIANGLLKDAFGSRYQIEFHTTRLSGTGKVQKQVEDFLIQVLDTETGDSQEFSTLSGGEAVWIRRALYDAFGIIRANNTDLMFLTAFMDEADGALDPEAKLTYLRMLESAHRQAGRRHTIIITHSEELQELIETKIEVAKLKPRAVKEAA